MSENIFNESPLFDQMRREYLERTGHSYETLLANGPVELRSTKKGPRIAISDEYAKTVGAGDIVINDYARNALAQAQDFQRAIVESCFTLSKAAEPAPQVLTLSERAQKLEMRGRKPLACWIDEVGLENYAPANLIQKDTNMRDIEQFFQSIRRDMNWSQERPKGREVRVSVPFPLYNNDIPTAEQIDAWKDEALRQLKEDNPGVMLVEMHVTQPTDFFADSMNLVLIGVVPAKKIKPNDELTEIERIELGDRVADFVESGASGPCNILASLSVPRQPAEYVEYAKADVEETELIYTMTSQKSVLDEVVTRALGNKFEPMTGVSRTAPTLTHDEAITTAKILKPKTPIEDVQLPEILDVYLGKVAQVQKNLIDENPGGIITDMRVERTADGGAQVFIEGVAPKNPEDAEVLAELVERSKASPELRQILFGDDTGSDDE